jgi:serine/threonine protein kinase
VALDLPSAVEYLHSNGVIHRDLKPHAIGFDSKGNIKLMDLGVAKEIDLKKNVRKDSNAPVLTLSTRIDMAPEFAVGETYTILSDVYSLGIILWQLCSLQDTPFEELDNQDYLRFCIYADDRPQVSKEWPLRVSELMSWMWRRNPMARPYMTRGCEEIERQSLWRSRDCRQLGGPLTWQ